MYCALKIICKQVENTIKLVNKLATLEFEVIIGKFSVDNETSNKENL